MWEGREKMRDNIDNRTKLADVLITQNDNLIDI